MRWSNFLAVTVFFVSPLLWAQDSKNEKAKNISYSGKQSEEWMQVQTQLITVKGKVENQQKLVENLIMQKENLKGKEQSEKIEQLKKEHTELMRLIQHYNQLSLDFQTKFPEKGSTMGRVYKRMDTTNVEGIQKQMTLDGRLKRLSHKVKKKDSQELVSDPKSSGSEVTDQIILQK